MKKLVIGILAHVDAGKTTLSEALLYTIGKIKKAGRVDWRNTFLDNHDLERERGITIFSKQALLTADDIQVTLVDTPGHVDFSAETERTLAVLDYAVLVISASDGVQAHTETLWHLLERYHVPTFVFITKTDLPDVDKAAVLEDCRQALSSGCVDFSDRENLGEQVAMCDETALEEFLEDGNVSEESITRCIRERKLFPCFFGSGLRLTGVDVLWNALSAYTVMPLQRGDFSARVHKIAYDPSGGRLTYIKVTGGRLSVRQSISYTVPGTGETVEEKITAIRMYSGAKFQTADTAEPGDLCAVTGLSKTCAGMGLGTEEASLPPYLDSVLYYKISLPPKTDARTLLPKFRELEEEEPLLHIVWNERFEEIHAQVMGQVQIEVLTSILKERFDIDAEFTDRRILYKETIAAPVEGVGHFEPLRHYAEVHLLLEPLPHGSGLVFDSICPENYLDRNWQRLIQTHLEEKQHIGVLTGAPITDMKITLVAGKAHLKHTQGGDFRESTYRAVRHGLMCAAARDKAVLLEPYYAYRLELPGECVGRAITDILNRNGTFEEHEATTGFSVLLGRAPVAAIGDYSREVASYTHGRGRFSCRFDGYFPCHNPETVLAETNYNPEADVANTPDSVFCAHGAGFVVPWYQVTEYMHLEGISLAPKNEEISVIVPPKPVERNVSIDEKELEAIMEREFGPIRRKVYGDPKKPVVAVGKTAKAKKTLYIVDGYNVIFAWEELAAIAENDLEDARRQLCEILANYQAFTKREMILVFDAYNVKGATARKFDYQGVHVVYTKEGELGDTYIDKLTSEIGKDYSVRVITSDGLIQLQALRSGVLRMSAREFREEILTVDEEIWEILENLRQK